MTATPFVRRRDISVTEEREFEQYRDGTQFFTAAWTASLDGVLSTGEYVGDMARQGNTFAEALENLEQAIRENGWEVR